MRPVPENRTNMMTWPILLTVLSLLTILTYTLCVCIEIHGIPASLSVTFFRIRHPLRFQLTLVATAGLLLPGLLAAGAPHTSGLVMSASSGMMLIALAPNFRKPRQEIIHVIGAVMSLVSSQVWMVLNMDVCLWLWAVCVSAILVAMLFQKRKSLLQRFLGTRLLFWIEITSLGTTYASVLWRLIKL